MIRFRALGSIDLRDADDRELRSLLMQPKRLALLAYLAVASPPGYHRRDTILALFWPELGQERARAALRQAVHFLRRTLGAGAVHSHGAEDIGLGDGVVWCDVRAFNEALAHGDPADALALYRGDLLDGFFVSDASGEFDAWLEAERGRLRERAIDAAWSLSDRDEASGRAADAAQWARWAAARAPDDERTQRRLVALLDRLGDRTGALRAYEQLAQRARAEFDAEPSPETRALVAAIRARDTLVAPHLVEREIAPPPRATVPAAAAVPAGAAAAILPAVAPRPVRRSRGWMLAVIAAVVAVAGAALLDRSPRVAAAPVSGSRVPATHATTSSRTAARFFEAGLRALYDQGDARLARSLFADALNEDTTFAMAALYAARCDGILDSPDGTAMMQRAMRLAAHATERERLIIEMSWATMTEDPDRIQVAESLATRYPDEPEGHIALGTALIGMGDFLGAVPHLRRVIASDTLSGSGEPLLCSSCLAFDQLVAVYFLADSMPAAERAAREWVQRHPRSISAWATLRDVLSREGRPRDATDAERHVTSLDPATDADIGAAIIAVHEDDWAEADRALTQRLRYGSPSTTETALWWLIIVRRNEGRLDDARRLAQQLAALHAPGPPPQLAVLAEAQVLFEQGQPRRAAQLFDSLAALPPNPWPPAAGSIARHRSWFLTHAATAWAAAGDTARLARRADAVEGEAHASAYGRDWRLPHYLRGLLWEARGDHVQSLRELQQSIWAPSEGYTRANLELARAYLSVGRPHAAIPLLQAALRGPVEASNYYVTRTEIHDLLARSYAAAGDTDSAAAHYAVVARSWHGGDTSFRHRAALASGELTRLAAAPRTP